MSAWRVAPRSSPTSLNSFRGGAGEIRCVISRRVCATTSIRIRDYGGVRLVYRVGTLLLRSRADLLLQRSRACGRPHRGIVRHPDNAATNCPPQIEMNFYNKSDSSRGFGSGLSEIDSGFRIRYEITRRFAPYLGFGYTGS